MPNRAFWHGRRVVVTGHTGFKGAWLCSWLADMGAVVTGISLPPAPDALYGRIDLDRRLDSRLVDIRAHHLLEHALASAAPEIVFHLAAQALVPEALAAPVGTFQTNVMGVVNLLDGVRRLPSLRAVIVVTSDKCYREPHRLCAEADPLGGSEPYGASKACAEIVTEAYRQCFLSPADGIGVATARAGNVIGGGDRATGRLLPDLVRAQEAGAAPELRDPMAVRPWQHVLDALAGYLLLAERLVEDPVAHAGAWNFGPAEDVAWTAASVAETVASQLPGERWRRGPPAQRQREAPVLRLSSERARTELGWRPQLSTEEAIGWAVEGYQALRRGETAWLLDQIRRHEALALQGRSRAAGSLEVAHASA